MPCCEGRASAARESDLFSLERCREARVLLWQCSSERGAPKDSKTRDVMKTYSALTEFVQMSEFARAGGMLGSGAACEKLFSAKRRAQAVNKNNVGLEAASRSRSGERNTPRELFNRDCRTEAVGCDGRSPK